MSDTKVFQVNPSSREELTVRNRIYGILPGIVEYNLDPLHTGRIKVRVPLVHQTEVSIETEGLPWALPIQGWGGVHDTGSYNVPPVGATVYVQFMAGDPEQPLYHGGWYKTPTQPRAINVKVSKKSGEQTPDVERFPISMKHWFQPIGPEVPSEVAATPYHDPTVRIVTKTPKGHTVITEDRDGFESLRVIDRAGQELFMTSPVDDDKNADNGLQRRRREARDGDALTYEDLASGGASLELVGVSGQRVRMSAGKDAEFVEVVSQTPPTPGGENSEVKLTLGAGTGLLEAVGTFKGKETFRLCVETSTGQVSIDAGGGIRIKSDMLSVLANLIHLAGSTCVDGDLTVGGSVLASGRLLGRNSE